MTLSLINHCLKCLNPCCHPGDPLLSEKERNEIINAGHKDLMYEVKSKFNEKFYRIKNENKQCSYLVDNKCSIEKVKPVLCRAFPVDVQWNYKENKREFGLRNDCYAMEVINRKFINEAVKEFEKVSDEWARKFTSDIHYEKRKKRHAKIGNIKQSTDRGNQ
ncbi:MAG TPA: YkgJ family cysteine cluster protein [archaeon]|nr:YkgJ family cysteine cluster protein [archaeon]